MTKRKQSLCQNKTGFDYQLNTLRISYFQRKKIHIFIVEYFYTFPTNQTCTSPCIRHNKQQEG